MQDETVRRANTEKAVTILKVACFAKTKWLLAAVLMQANSQSPKLAAQLSLVIH